MATVLGNGTLMVNGEVFTSPSGAGKAVAGRNVNGWTFWRLESADGQKLRDLQRMFQPYDASNSVGPFDETDFDDWVEASGGEFEELANLVTQSLHHGTKLTPLQLNKGEFRLARFWGSTKEGPNICIGVPQVALEVRPRSPLWGRYLPDTPDFLSARENLLHSRDDVWFDPATGHMWIPLEIPLELSNEELVQEVVDQVRVIDMEARGGSSPKA